MENSFQIGDKEFKISKLDAVKQFHIVRRIGSLIADIIPIMSEIATLKVDSLSQEAQLKEFAKLAKPFMDGLAKLSDADANYVLYRLLGATEIKQPEFNTWARIAKDDQLMIQTIDLPTMMQIAVRVFMYNLSGFFALLPQK